MFDRSTAVLVLAGLVAAGCFSNHLGARAAEAAMREQEKARVRDVALHVMHVTGVAKANAEPQALVPGDVLRYGEAVHLAEGAKLRLVTPDGDRLRIEGPGTVRIGERALKRVLKLAQDRGKLDFVAAASGTLEVETPRGVVWSAAGSFVAYMGWHLYVEARVPPVQVDGVAVRIGQPVNR